MKLLSLLPFCLLIASGCSSEDASSPEGPSPDAASVDGSLTDSSSDGAMTDAPPDSNLTSDGSVLPDSTADSVVAADAASDSPDPSKPRFFRADSLWNTPVSNEPVQWYDIPAIRSGCWYVNYQAYSNPVVLGADSDPVVVVPAPASWGWPATELKIHVPSGVTGATGTDGSLVVISDNVAYDFWQFVRTSETTATVVAWAQANIITGTGWADPNAGKAAGIRAGGSAGLAGEIYGNELTEGIHHALGIAAVIEISGLGGEHRPPAVSGDGPMEGLRLGIPPSTPKPAGLSVQGSHFWDALVTYGGWLADRAYGSCPILFNADPRSVPQADVDALHGDIDKIRDHVRIIDYAYPYNP